MTESAEGTDLVLRAANTGMFGKNVPGAGVAFDVHVGEMEKPSFSFGDSVSEVVASGKKYRFHFGDSMVPDESDLAEGIGSCRHSKRSGKALRAALGLE